MKLRQQYHFRQSEQGLLAWDVTKLIVLTKDSKIEQVPLKEIGELNETYWFGLGESLIAVDIANHAKQIYEADLFYPIILCPEGRVMDGMHRVCKAYLEGLEHIPAVKLAVLHAPDYVGKQPDELPY